MTRRQALAAAAVVTVAVLALWAPLAGAASDLYANLGPGGLVSPSVDRYPLGNYVLDSHFSAVKASLTGGVDASGVPSMIAYFLANLLWQITAFAAYAVISLFALAFSVDLLNGSPNTAGTGALAPVGDAIHNLYANTLGQPWMEVAVVFAGCWAMWRALVQRRYSEAASTLGMSLVFCLLALAIVTKPDATIGQASRWTNEISAAFLSITAHGEVTNGPAARRAASDYLFNLLVFRPWVALQFGGTEHCIRKNTGSQQHDPESVPVRPLALTPQADARARQALHRDGHLTTATKECVDNTVRYPDHFLRYAPGSDDREAQYDAINNADPSKLPDSDPTNNAYRPGVVDKPVTDAMEKGGQYQRLLLALVILLGEIGAFLLLGALCVSVLLAQMVVLLLAAFSPVALIAAIVPGRGHELFKAWAGQLATYLVRKAAYSLVLAVLLAVIAALQDATTNLGWLLSFALQSMLMWMVFLQRQKLAGQLTAAISGQQPAREAQLRKLLGVAYLARQVNPARRRPQPRSGPDADDPGQASEQPPASAPQPPAVTAGAPDMAPQALPSSGRGHRPPGARRDRSGNAGTARSLAPADDSGSGVPTGDSGSLVAADDQPGGAYVLAARRHTQRTRTAAGHEPPISDELGADENRDSQGNGTSKRPSGDSRARPSRPSAHDDRRERDHDIDIADGQPPAPPPDEPPSLVDQLRADQPRRPHTASGDDAAAADGGDAEPRA